MRVDRENVYCFHMGSNQGPCVCDANMKQRWVLAVDIIHVVPMVLLFAVIYFLIAKLHLNWYQQIIVTLRYPSSP